MSLDLPAIADHIEHEHSNVTKVNYSGGDSSNYIDIELKGHGGRWASVLGGGASRELVEQYSAMPIKIGRSEEIDTWSGDEEGLRIWFRELVIETQTVTETKEAEVRTIVDGECVDVEDTTIEEAHEEQIITLA